MRRRQVHVPPGTSGHTALFVAAGAIAGAAAGMYLGRRYRTMDAFLEDVRDRLDDLRLAWRTGAGDDDMDVLVARGEDYIDDIDDTDEAARAEAWDEEYDAVGAPLDDDRVGDDDELGDLAESNGNGHANEAAAHARLERRVLEALQRDRRLRSRAIEIAVVGDGVVELTGSVHAIEEISRAAAVVRTVAGVAMVLNRIELRPAGAEGSAEPRAAGASPAGEAPPTE